MALVVKDRVKESTTTTGTGTISLGGAATGFQTFVAGIGTTNTTYYAIVDNVTGDYEVGIGTVTDATPDTLSRDTILESSNGGAAVNLQSGTKNVFCTQPAEKAVYQDASGDVDITGVVTTEAVEIDDTDAIRLRFLNNGTFKGGVEVATSAGDMIGTSAIDDLAIRSQSNILFSTGGNTERVQISSSGNVGIGTTSPEGLISFPATASNTPKFRLQSATSNVDVAISSYADANGTYASFGANNYLNSSGNDAAFDATKRSAYVFVDGRNLGAVTFGTAASGTATERMRLDASGNLGIGCSPSDRLEVKGATSTGVIVISSGDTTLTGNDVIGQLNFKDYDADAHVGGDQDDVVNIKAIALHETGGATAFDGSANEGYALSFSTSKRPSANAAFTVSEAMRIDSSGNLLVGHEDYTTAVDNGSTGVTLGADGRLTASRANTVARFNREDSDGTITDFMKDGAVVGSIGTTSSGLTIGSGDTGLFFDSAEDSVKPRNSSGAARDAAIDLGKGSHRFRDLYLSGDSYITFTDNNTFSASTSSWHNIIVRNESENAGNSCGIVFELNDTYHQNAGTGIAAVKANTSGDYGADLVIITRPESAAAVERMRVTNTGNVGIGTSSPQSELHVKGEGEILRIESTDATGDCYITFRDSSANKGYIGYGSSAHNHLSIENRETSSDIFFQVGTTEAMRIDSSGNLLVGTTDSGSTLIAATSGGGINIDPDGYTAWNRQAVSSNQAHIVFNQTGVNAQYFEFRKDGATVGSIGSVSGSVLAISTPSNYLSFRTDSDGDNEEVVWDSAQAGGTWRPGTDNLSDIGYSSRRWKDLYLSGVAYAESNVLAGGTSASSSGQVAVISSTSPFVSFHEGSTRKAYIQWVNSGYLQIRNEEGTDVRIRGNGDTELELADNAGSVHGRLKIYTASADFAMQHENGEQIVYGRKNQNTWLYYNGQWKIRTQANGIDIRNEEDAYSEIRMTTGANADTRGYFYANTSNQIGILDSGGSWAVKHINDQGTQFYTDGGTSNFRIGGDLVSGDYGTVQTDVYKAGWSGYSITGNWVFMGNGSANCGIYNDTDNEWAIYCVRNAETRLYYNGTEYLRTLNGGVDVSGDLYVDDQIIHNGDTDTYMQFHAADEWRVVTGGVERLEVNNSGITASVDITVNSDERIKDNIEQIPDALEKVQAIRGVTFTRTDTEDDTRHAGVIAQEVEKVLPEVVTENAETGIKSVAYANMVGLLIEAIKEQQTQIDDLKNEVTRLKGY